MKYLYGFVMSAILLLGCSGSKSVTSDNDLYYGLKKVSIDTPEMVQGDLSQIPGWQDDKYALPNGQAGSGIIPRSIPGLSGTLALLDFKEAKVTVFWHNESGNPDTCVEWQSNYAAFKDKSYTNWDEVIAGCRMMPNIEVVYNGLLTISRSDTSVKGTIYVKPGKNVVVVGFIDSNNRIVYVTFVHYYYYSGTGLPLPLYYSDGWERDLFYNNQIMWNTWQYISYHEATYNFDYYTFPGLGAAYYLGITKAYADYQCSR
jgi:hypothetical protein